MSYLLVRLALSVGKVALYWHVYNDLHVEHAMSTTLEKVGQQVWRGALLMTDYLLSQGNPRLQESVVLELGAGTGLVSIVAASKAQQVFCTGTLL